MPWQIKVNFDPNGSKAVTTFRPRVSPTKFHTIIRYDNESNSKEINCIQIILTCPVLTHSLP